MPGTKNIADVIFAAGYDSRGATTVEAAIAFPVFFLLIFAIVSAGQVLTSYVYTADALRQASREAMLGGVSCENVALSSVRDRVSQSLFRPNISGVNISFENYGGVPGAVFEVRGQMNCAACDLVFGGLLDFSAATFVPLELPGSCST